ncbi:hypothetical protein DFP94_1011338 [Fontibacillus phaseoli]|uniref:Flavodoxin n=1 Tax=Fontibacillus phaseoli TaxID=1416533 RepID=A0A369BT27_9BACL|nr:hypothetical protein [Fontibacillus phaseoli]RCX23736.1 hypothetical protein DFP94_1011338 [Fontibacillus phaseoli]
MNIAVVSYSYTGNNDMFAACVAKGLSATHIKIATQKPMTMGSIIMDMIFARTPKMQPCPNNLKQYDLILFFAPIWMGHIASPLREYLHRLKSSPQAYGFFSISGGADGGNPKLFAELLKRTGTKPAIVLDQHIRDFIPQNSKPTRNDTSAFKISEAEASKLSTIAIKEINKLTT